ncbi:MAG TPA: carbamoyltransferase HypF [Bryobacteraceae bacterium]|nr:carbamoyltransferase HypF [Bryobacteraceae bacterium]
MTAACDIRVRGVVQGVGFRPFVFRLAQANTLAGWVLNDGDGIRIHLEGAEPALDEFVRSLVVQRPPAANIHSVDVHAAQPAGFKEFTIRSSGLRGRPSVQVSPDLPVCDRCLQELFEPANPRYHYPYINCTDCGPRYSVITSLPYDRGNTTMQAWPMDCYCAVQYHDPGDRRFHAQPIACPACGPHYFLRVEDETVSGDAASIHRAARLLNDGSIVAVKGLGGYHLACDARNAAAVKRLRERKFRKEKPFALMVKNIDIARDCVELSAEAESLMTSVARPIVLARAKVQFPFVCPENDDLGLMLPYTPLHHLLFAAGAPDVLVMTSANRSSEPISYQDEDATERLAGIADAFLVGERPIARRVDDSVARVGCFGPVVLRRARGYAPSAVTAIPFDKPVLAVGADLKNTITLVVGGHAMVSQHIGDLDQYESFQAFRETIHHLVSMYEVPLKDCIIAHDAHPQYLSSIHVGELGGAETHSIQHHRAHIASVLAERAAWDHRVLGVAFDGTGYGDDGSIWGGEFFIGSIVEGFERIAHLRPAALAGGDAAARHPVQAAAGFLSQTDNLPDLTAEPFCFTVRYEMSLDLIRSGLRTFTTTSAGRLFDAAAALLGFTREITFEGQAAMWVEYLARTVASAEPYAFPFNGRELDFRPLLEAVALDRRRGRDASQCARAFQHGVAKGLYDAITMLCETWTTDTVVLSGGVFQNELLLEDLKFLTEGGHIDVWTNRSVPPNDGGVSLGQAALAAFKSLHA